MMRGLLVTCASLPCIIRLQVRMMSGWAKRNLRRCWTEECDKWLIISERLCLPRNVSRSYLDSRDKTSCVANLRIDNGQQDSSSFLNDNMHSDEKQACSPNVFRELEMCCGMIFLQFPTLPFLTIVYQNGSVQYRIASYLIWKAFKESMHAYLHHTKQLSLHNWTEESL